LNKSASQQINERLDILQLNDSVLVDVGFRLIRASGLVQRDSLAG
jgi:hypothetical protein